MKDDIHPQTAFSLNLPKGLQTCDLAIINTTCDLTVPAGTLVHELMNFPTFAFLLKHESSGRQVLFDLGCRKDFWNLPPHISSIIESHVPGIKVEKNLVEVLEDGKVDVADIHAAIISHHHYDHTGDLASFPKSVELVVGPGFTENCVPGYPTSQNSPFFEDAFEGRTVNEISFSDQLKIGDFQAYDYFDDGSLYILNVPGHAIVTFPPLCERRPKLSSFWVATSATLPEHFDQRRTFPCPPRYLAMQSSTPPTRIPSLACSSLNVTQTKQTLAHLPTMRHILLRTLGMWIHRWHRRASTV